MKVQGRKKADSPQIGLELTLTNEEYDELFSDETDEEEKCRMLKAIIELKIHEIDKYSEKQLVDSYSNIAPWIESRIDEYIQKLKKDEL